MNNRVQIKVSLIVGLVFILLAFSNQVKAANTTWTGGNSTTWNNAGNWNNGVPNNNTFNVTIPTGCPRYPTVGTNSYTIGSLATMGNGASISGTGTITISNAATCTTTGTATISCPLSISVATNFTETNSTDQLTISGGISGSIALTQAGNGILVLSGANTYTGGTIVNAGTLKLGISSAISTAGPLGATGAGSTSIASGAVLDLNGYSLTGTYNEAITLNGTGLTASPAGALTNTGGNASIVGSITLGSAATITATTSGTLGVAAITNGTLVLTLDGAGNGTVSGIIGASTGTVTKNGFGTWTLSGANTYSGTTTISAGTLKLGNASALGGTGGSTTVADGAILDLNGQIIGSEPLVIQGAGALINSSGTASLAGNITGSTTYTVGGSGGITLTGNVQGTLTKVGANTLTLSGTVDNVGLGLIANSGTVILAKTSDSGHHAIGGGGLIIGGATVQLGGTGGDQIYDGCSVTINSGTFDLHAQSETIPVLTGTGGTILNNGGSASTLNYGSGGGTYTYSGIIANGSSGNGGLSLIQTSGTYTMSGLNTYSGSTTVNGGILKAGSTQSFGVNSAVSLANTAGVGLDITGFNTTIGSLTGGGTTGGNVNLGAATLTMGSDNTTTVYSGIISDTGAGAITKIGTGAFTLSGTNTYNGVTTINTGTIILGNVSALGTTAGGTTVANGAVLDLNGQIIGSEQLGIQGTGIGNTGALINSSATAASLSGDIIIRSSTYSVGGSGNITLTGNVQGTLIKVGTNALTLSGSLDNDGLGMIVNAGIIILAKTSSSVVHAIGGGGLTINGGTVQLAGSGGDQIYNGCPIILNGGNLVTTGTSEAVSTLALTDNSTLALGSGSHSLSFVASNSVGWTNGTWLTITGWTGSFNSSGTAGKVFVGTNNSGLTTSQLSQIIFYIGGTNYTATQLSSGEVVPTGTVFTPTFSYTTPVTLVVNAFISLTPTTNLPPTSYSVVGTPLPTGLNLNPSTGVISGTPTGQVAAANYTIKATYGSGFTYNSVINITVRLGTTYYSRLTGNWNDFNTWSLASGGPIAGNGIFPLAGDNVIIEKGKNVSATADAACATITFTTNTATSLTINPGFDLNVSGTVTIPRPGSGVNLIAVGSGNLNAGTIAFTSGGTNVYHKITISTGTVTVSGDITTDVNGTSATIAFTDVGTLNVGGQLMSSGTGGTLTTVAGCTVNYNGAAQVVKPVTYYGNLTLSGSGAKTTTGVTVNGILSMAGDGTVTASVQPTYVGTTTLQYNASAAQTTGIEFPATFNGTGVIINNSNGVTLNGAKTISSLTLTNGILNTNTNVLSVTGNSSSAITVGSATSFINGPVKWNLPAILPTGSTYVFPVGNTTYLPFTLVNPTTGSGTPTAQVQAFNSASGGTADVTTLDSISHTEYWSLTTGGNFTNSSVSLARQTTIIPVLDAVAGSTASNGIYTPLVGTVGTYGVSNSNSIGTDQFFVLAKGIPLITTSPATLTGFTYSYGNGPSSPKYFTIKGNYLSTNITVLPTDSFEISLTTGSLFAPQSKITLQVLNGTVALDTVYVRMKAGFPVGTVISKLTPIECSSDNAITQTISCSGTVTNIPTITATPATLSGFYYNVSSGGPSNPQSFNVTSSYLTSTISVTAPTDYEVQLGSGGSYASSQTLPSTGGSINVRLKSGLLGGVYNENIALSSITSTTTVNQNVALSGSVNQPTINVSIFNLGGFIYTLTHGPSGYQSFNVSGQYLTANIVLTAPANFEICQTSGGTYSSTITLTQSSGTVPITTIYVRLKAGIASVQTIAPINLTVASTGSSGAASAVQQNVILSGAVVNSATSISSNNTLVGFVYTFGHGPSVVQSFKVSGTSLTNNIVVTAPTGGYFQISQDSTTWVTTFNITPTSGTVNAVPVYVRLAASLAISNTLYSGLNITLASTGATNQNVACTGVVIAAPTITAGPSNLESTCPNTSVTLTANGTGISSYVWNGPNGYYSTDQNPVLGVVTAANNGTYTVTGNALSGVNLLTNGGFESGNTGFGTSYTFDTSEPQSNQDTYNVGPNPSIKNSAFCNQTGGHTGNNQMFIDGATLISGGAGVIAWSESVSVVPGANYQFSFWVQSLVTTSPAQLQLYVNGAPVGTPNNAPATACSWTSFTYITNSGSNTVLQLALVDLNLVADGNDFALDDIMFQQSFPASSSVTLTVNPTLPVSVSITASINPLYSGSPVTFTANPVNGGTAPSYQWKVNGTNAGSNSSTFTYSPAINDVITCVLSNTTSPCTTGNPATSNTLTAISRTNFWVGTYSTDWGTASNWSGNFIPAPGNDVEYATNTNHSYQPAINDLQLDQNRTIGSLVNATNKRLIIPAGKSLIVNNTINTDGDVSRIYIQTDPSLANGSLIFHNSSGSPVYGTVDMYARGSWSSAGILDPGNGITYHYTWQYFGIPIHSVQADPTFYGSYVRSYNEGSTVTNGKWTSLTNSSVLSSFTGYEITQTNPTTIQFQGLLENGDQSISLSYSSGASVYDPGQNILSNSYTSAINIGQLSFGPYTEPTIYIYNTGSFASWYNSNGENTNSTSSTTPGQYIAIPYSAAHIGTIPYDIPSMSGFLVRVSANDVLNLNYNSVIIPNVSPQRAPSQNKQTSDKVFMEISLKGKYSGDRMWLINQEGTTRGFDRGWDGYKLTGDAGTPQLFAMEESGNYQVSTSDDMSNTYLGFQAGIDLEDTLTFYNENFTTRYTGVYLVDLVENIVTDITKSGTQYTFITESTPTPVKRFMIVTQDIKNATENTNTQLKVFNSGHVVFVQNTGNLNGEMIVYDMMGHLLRRAKFGPLGVTAIQLAAIPGPYVVKAATSNETVSKRVILGE